MRWTDDERAALVRRCQSLRVEYPAASITELLDKSQAAFPPERRRPSNPAIRSWLASELQRAAPAPGEARIWRPEPGASAAPEVRAEAAPAAAVAAAPAEPSAAAVAAPTSPLIATLVETGVQVLLGILGDERVRGAVATLVAPVPAPVDDAARRCVVIAGIAAAEVAAVEKALDGALELRFWSPDQPREQLQQLLPEARLVIGLPEGLTPALESSLRNLGARYVRHDSGMPGLYRRLASEAMR